MSIRPPYPSAAQLAADPALTDAFTAPGENDLYGASITNGMCSLPSRRSPNTNASAATGFVFLTFFKAPKSFTAANMRLTCGTTAAGATPTLVKYGLYTVAANGDITLAAQTASDTGLFAVASNPYPKALSSPATLAIVKHAWYASAVLVVTGATAPTIAANPLLAWTRHITSTVPRLNGQVGGQTDLPASVVSASIAASDHQIFAEILT